MKLKTSLNNLLYKNIIKYSSIIIFLSLFLYSIVLIINSRSIPFSNREIWTDSSVFLYIGNAMKQGIVPYRDIFDHKGPLLYMFNFLGCLISTKYGIWFVELMCIYTSIVFSYLLCKKIIYNKFVSFIVVIAVWSLLDCYYEGGNRVEEYSLPFITISLYYFIDYYLKKIISTKKVVICGMCMSAVLLLRPNMIGIWICFCLFITIDLIIHKSWKNLVIYICFFCIGVVIVLTPVIVFNVINHSLGNFIECYLTFNLKYSQSKGNINNIFKLISFLTKKSFIPYIIIFYGILTFNLKKLKNNNLAFIVLINFIINLYLVSISGRAFGHYGMILIPCILLMAILLLDLLWYSLRDQKVRIYTIYTIILIILSLSCGSNIYLYGKYIREYLVNIKTPLKENILITNILKNSNKSDNIIVIGNNCDIYLESSRMAASKYIYQYPIGNVDDKIISEFIKDIYTNKPKIIVAFKSSFKQVPDELKDYINDRYINIFEDKNYILYKFNLQD